MLFRSVRRVDDGTGKKVPEKPYEKIIALAESKGFVVVGRTEATLTEAQAVEMYSDSSGKSWFKKEFLPYITGNKVTMLALQRDNAVEEWRQLIGPADVKKAAKEAPDSICAIPSSAAPCTAFFCFEVPHVARMESGAFLTAFLVSAGPMSRRQASTALWRCSASIMTLPPVMKGRKSLDRKSVV